MRSSERTSREQHGDTFGPKPPADQGKDSDLEEDEDDDFGRDNEGILPNQLALKEIQRCLANGQIAPGWRQGSSPMDETSSPN